MSDNKLVEYAILFAIGLTLLFFIITALMSISDYIFSRIDDFLLINLIVSVILLPIGIIAFLILYFVFIKKKDKR